MTKIEEALCNGITFSVPRMVPTAVQEGELDNTLYYVIAYLTPQLDKILLKFYEAPSYKPLKWNGNDIECIIFEVEKSADSDSENMLVGYNFGPYRDGTGIVYPGCYGMNSNLEQIYDGLALYPGLKCLIVSTINEIMNQTK